MGEQAAAAQIVPTVTAADANEYARLYKQARALSGRIHLDFSDGKFAPSQTIALAQAYWEDDVQIDLHLMLEHPQTQLEQCVALAPSLVITHFEAPGFGEFWAKAREQLAPHGIKLGVALLGETAPAAAAETIAQADHVLVFTGKLGYYGGELDTGSLTKLAAVREINSTAEVAVDGGITAANATQIVTSGANVLDVGSYLQKAADPREAYAKLKAVVQETQPR